MPIAKGEPWGRPGALPADGMVVASDAEARHAVEQARRANTAIPTLGLRGGDLFRTLGGRVEAGAAPGGGDWVVVEVADQGTGIPAEARDKVFDLLFSTKGSKGTGLGLALTKKIIEEHGGTVGFETEMGVGTTFFVRLPRRKQRPAPGKR